MQKVILMSILAVSIIVPAIAARERNPRLALRKVLLWTAIGVFGYVMALLFIYPRFLG
jgi:cyanate permease